MTVKLPGTGSYGGSRGSLGKDEEVRMIDYGAYAKKKPGEHKQSRPKSDAETREIEDAITQGKGREMEAYFSQGERKAEEILGIGAGEIGEKRAGIRGKYEDLLNRPSMAASRLTEQGQAAMRNLMSQQGQRNIQGGVAMGQQLQAKSEFGRQGAVQEQMDYLDILNKLERQYRGAGGDTIRLGSQLASLGVADQPMPSGSGGFMDFFSMFS